MSLCGSTTSVNQIRFLVILKAHQFIVQINVFGEMLAYCCDTETTYQSFLWFYTSLRHHYNQSGNQTYSTMERLNFSLCGGILRTPSSVSSRQTQLQHPSTTSSLHRSNFLFKHPMFLSKIPKFPFLILQFRHI